MLTCCRFIQLLLVLLNVLVNRRLQRTNVEAPAPPYTYDQGPYGADEKDKDVEVDWKSVVSADSLVSDVKTAEKAKV